MTITHTPAGGGYGAEEVGTVDVKVSNQGMTDPDDPDGFADSKGLDFSSIEPVVIEGQPETYTVKLKTKPTGTVTVELNRTTCTPSPSCDTTEHIRISPQFLTFTTGNWDSPQIVTLTGFNDDVDNEDNDETFDRLTRKTTITHRPVAEVTTT